MLKKTVASLAAMMATLVQPLASSEMPPATEIAAAVPSVYLEGPKDCQEPAIIGQGVTDGVVGSMILATLAIGAIAGFVAWGHNGHHHHRHHHHHH